MNCMVYKFDVDYMFSDAWQEYLTHALCETRDRDRQILGGIKPENYGQPGIGGLPGDGEGAAGGEINLPKQQTSNYVPQVLLDLPPGLSAPPENQANSDQVRLSQIVCTIPCSAISN